MKETFFLAFSLSPLGWRPAKTSFVYNVHSTLGGGCPDKDRISQSPLHPHVTMEFSWLLILDGEEGY